MLKELGLNGTLIAAIVQIILLLGLLTSLLIVIWNFIIKGKFKRQK